MCVKIGWWWYIGTTLQCRGPAGGVSPSPEAFQVTLHVLHLGICLLILDLGHSTAWLPVGEGGHGGEEADV
jgi:hypothetical protein